MPLRISENENQVALGQKQRKESEILSSSDNLSTPKMTQYKSLNDTLLIPSSESSLPPTLKGSTTFIINKDKKCQDFSEHDKNDNFLCDQKVRETNKAERPVSLGLGGKFCLQFIYIINLIDVSFIYLYNYLCCCLDVEEFGLASAEECSEPGLFGQSTPDLFEGDTNSLLLSIPTSPADVSEAGIQEESSFGLLTPSHLLDDDDELYRHLRSPSIDNLEFDDEEENTVDTDFNDGSMNKTVLNVEDGKLRKKTVFKVL